MRTSYKKRDVEFRVCDPFNIPLTQKNTDKLRISFFTNIGNSQNFIANPLTYPCLFESLAFMETQNAQPN